MKLPDPQKADLFSANLKAHVDFVLHRFRSDPGLDYLRGDNPFKSLEMAQLYLARTLDAVFQYGEAALHFRILPWVYRSYTRHRFHRDYFSRTLSLWIESFERLDPDNREAIGFLKALLDLDGEMRQEADRVPPSYLGEHPRLQGLLMSLIAGDGESYGPLLDGLYRGEIDDFARNGIQPLMYEVGRYWEMDMISVADEHRITAVIANEISSRRRVTDGLPRRTVLISPAPNEFHELGALIVSEEFRRRGWKVIYLNAGTPEEEVLRTIGTERPAVAALSTALILHGVALKRLVGAIKKRYRGLPIILGGKFIVDNPEVPVLLGCHTGGPNPSDAVALAERLADERVD